MTKEPVTGNVMYTCYPTVHELEESMKSKELYADYTALDGIWKRRFEDYMTGRKTMPLTYDPFFKRIFNPDIHPEWLSGLLSAVIGESVTVEAVLPSEDTAISADSLLIMDIIVRLADGSLANVEVKRSLQRFQPERCVSAPRENEI